jgi:hypothetical protein
MRACEQIALKTSGHTQLHVPHRSGSKRTCMAAIRLQAGSQLRRRSTATSDCIAGTCAHSFAECTIRWFSRSAHGGTSASRIATDRWAPSGPPCVHADMGVACKVSGRAPSKLSRDASSRRDCTIERNKGGCRLLRLCSRSMPEGLCHCAAWHRFARLHAQQLTEAALPMKSATCMCTRGSR